MPGQTLEDSPFDNAGGGGGTNMSQMCKTLFEGEGGMLSGKHWGVVVNVLDTLKNRIREEELDPLLVREIRFETQGWGLGTLVEEYEEKC